jgi:hypothetical protein
MKAEVYTTMANSGLTDGLQVVTHFRQLLLLTKPDKQLTSYLLHPVKPPYAYPLPKFLVAGGLLTGRLDVAEKSALQARLAGVIADPVYRHRVQRIIF